jgi:exosortase
MSVANPVVGLILALGGFAILYAGIFAGLWRDWSADDNYSHGFLILPLAGYFIWERRHRLQQAEPRPSLLGLGVVLVSLGVLLVGVLGAERFLARVSMLGVVGGTVLFVLGWRHLRILAFPLAFVLLMIPIPALVFNQIAFPLQLLASQTGQAGLSAMHIPVLREGNIIFLASTTLEVAEACSGIRSLVSLLTLGIVFGYFTDSRLWMRAAVAAATIPIAVLSNGMRVAGIGVTANYYGAAAAEGFMHTFSGWLVFLLAFAMLLGVYRVLAWLSPNAPLRRRAAHDAHVIA